MCLLSVFAAIFHHGYLSFWIFSVAHWIHGSSHELYITNKISNIELDLITIQRPRFEKERNRDRDMVDRDRLAARSREPPARDRGDFKRPRY